MPPDPTTDPALDQLRTTFGFESFRDGQREAIDRLLAGQSVLAIFPTGSGKSLCYQLPALLLDGVTVVISPLIALMKDQIDFLIAKGVAAARLDSSVGLEDGRQTYRDLHDGRLKLLYIAPERLANERFLQTLKRLPIAMLAVDEAHCISEWGHNFRPDYMKLARLAKELNVGRVLGLTATATPGVATDIAAAFDIAADDVVQTGFYRANLRMHVTPTAGGDRTRVLLDRLRSCPPGPTIVYVTLQKTAETVAADLEAAGLPAKAYHAGMDADARHATQDWFMASSDAVVVATIAFGMGIDKRDIRYVYHYNLPKSLENYAQEIGRAGRDGQPSTCEMLASADDLTVLENFTFGDTPAPRSVAAIIDYLLGDRPSPQFDVSTYEMSGNFDARPLVIETLLTYLELDGIVASTGPFYSEYKFQPLHPSAAILERFAPRRRDFLRKILAQARKGKTWFTLSIDDACSATGEPREKIVAAMNYLEEQGDLKLQVAGARHGYRILRTDVALPDLSKTLSDRFLTRESRDVERLAAVTAFTQEPTCLTNHLLNYFGEVRPTPCGHCGRCAGEPPTPLPRTPHRPLDDAEARRVRALREEHADVFTTPRQLARFLCGISSPGFTRAKLHRHPDFGRLTDVPFRDVVTFASAAVRGT